MNTITTGTDFSGVGALDHAMNRVCAKNALTHDRVFACDMDKFARIGYIANHGEPKYYPLNVYDREIPSDPLDIYVTSPPCQDFSIAGTRPEESEKTILFLNSYEFIKINNPRFFIFENVKGLLSHNKKNKKDKIGQTFQQWLTMLGGKSVNGVPTIFPFESSVPYHIYYKVMNAKNHGIPQNRERVFIVGIRDDVDNDFSWPKEEQLTRRLKDILEPEVEPKYFLSEKMVLGLLKHAERHQQRGNGFSFKPSDVDKPARSITTNSGSRNTDNFIKVIGNTNPSQNGMNGNVYDSDGISPTLSTNKGEGIKVAQINPSKESGGQQPFKQNRIYKGEVSPALDTECGRPSYCVPVLTPDRVEKRQNGRRFKEDGDPRFTITTQDRHGIFDGYNIRRLTPLECFRLMDFPDEHVEKSKAAGISDSQLYKQAGNSVVVRCYELILGKLNLTGRENK